MHTVYGGYWVKGKVGVIIIITLSVMKLGLKIWSCCTLG